MVPFDSEEISKRTRLKQKSPNELGLFFSAEEKDNELTHLTRCISRFYFLVFSLETPLETKRPKGGLDCPC
jgi:hypothetical protein